MVALGLVAGAAVIVWLLRRRLEWVSIGLLAVAVGLAAWHEPLLLRVGRIEVWRPHWMAFTLRDLDGVWRGGLPQLALTLLNSVLAVASLASQLYPQHAARVTPTRMALSVGVMNVLVCPLGGMPLCHGSGGLAGQHKMGARSGLSVILLGLVKLILGLLLGGVALAWMRAFPAPILGLFLLLAGWSLAEASRAWDTRPGTAVSLLMLVTYYASASLPLAFGAGWFVCWRMQRGQPGVASLPAAVCPQPWRGTAA